MSTIVPMPVRVKPPPAETGDTISPGCASFEITTPVEGRADDRAVEIRALQRDLPLGHLHLFLRGADARVERVDGRAGRVDLGSGRIADADELRQAREVDSRLVEAHFAFVDVPARGFRLGLGQRHGRALRLIVQPREHLAFASPSCLLRCSPARPCP